MNFHAHNNIELLFRAFYDIAKNNLIAEKVDYFGINISANSETNAAFKIYYKDNFSREESHPLIDFLSEKGMIRYLTMVHDQKDSRCMRFDVGLKNRTNKNMTEVFEWLERNTVIFRQNRAEIEKLATMKLTAQSGFDYSDLYFLGFISFESEIKILKCHYFNRICADPDVLHKNLIFDDNYYLSFLACSGIEEFSYLSELLRDALRNCGGHLWMTGVDFALSSERKYKIYIKSPDNLYDGLLETFSGDENLTLRDRIVSVRDWNSRHVAFRCEGFAICLDEKKIMSINFYFKIDANT